MMSALTSLSASAFWLTNITCQLGFRQGYLESTGQFRWLPFSFPFTCFWRASWRWDVVRFKPITCVVKNLLGVYCEPSGLSIHERSNHRGNNWIAELRTYRSFSVLKYTRYVCDKRYDNKETDDKEPDALDRILSEKGRP